MVGKCYRLEINQGETLLLPSGRRLVSCLRFSNKARFFLQSRFSLFFFFLTTQVPIHSARPSPGWIHGVFTPEDSLVFGGNYLSELFLNMQLRYLWPRRNFVSMCGPTFYVIPKTPPPYALLPRSVSSMEEELGVKEVFRYALCCLGRFARRWLLLCAEISRCSCSHRFLPLKSYPRFMDVYWYCANRLAAEGRSSEICFDLPVVISLYRGSPIASPTLYPRPRQSKARPARQRVEILTSCAPQVGQH